MKQPKSTRKGKSSKAADIDAKDDPQSVTIDYERLRGLSSQVELRDVRLVGLAFANSATPSLLQNHQGELSFALNLVDARWDLERTFSVHLAYQLVAHTAAAELFRVLSSWVVEYGLPEAFQRPPSFESIADDFVMANGQVNLFPYLRQQITDLTTKAGWPPLILPVFRAPAKRPTSLVRAPTPLIRTQTIT